MTDNNREVEADFNDILSLEAHKKHVSETKEEKEKDTLNVNDIEGQIGRVSTLGPTGAVTPVRIATGFNPGANIDAIEQWRYMSEAYRKKRLLKEARENQLHNESETPVAADPNVIQAQKTAKFQENYETDNFHFTAPAPSFAEDLRRRILTADLEVNPDLLIESEHEEAPVLEDGTIMIADVMTKNVTCVIESMTVEQAASLFNRKNITGAPVVHYLSKQLVGIISISDILHHTFEDKAVTTFHNDGGGAVFQQDSLAILDKPVSDLMETDVIQVSLDCNVRDACNAMLKNNTHKVVVTQDGKVKGIFTSFDAVKLLADFDLKLHQDK